MLLVVEDDPLQLRLLREMLGTREHVATDSAARARELVVERRDWQGLILDLSLVEGQDAGLELLRWMRADETLRSLRCVVTTGHWDPSLAWEVPNVHRAEYVLKPVTFAGLSGFLDVTDRSRVQRREAVVARARDRYGLSDRQTQILAWFIEGRKIGPFLLHTNIGRKTFETHRGALLERTGDDTVEGLVARLLLEALEQPS